MSSFWGDGWIEVPEGEAEEKRTKKGRRWLFF
jgi:hypothetical protein